MLLWSVSHGERLYIPVSMGFIIIVLREKHGGERKDARRNIPVYTADSHAALRDGPFFEAGFVHVVPACCATPHNVFLVGLEFHEADGAVSFDWLSVAVCVCAGLGLGFFLRERGVVVDFAEFLLV